MENTEVKRKFKVDKAKVVGGWAKATEYVAKALVAIVGLVGLIIWEVHKNNK